VSSGQRKVFRLSRRGNRRHGHAIHMAAITQIRQPHSEGRACYDKKLAEGKTPKEALRSLKRQVSDAIFTRLQADARRAAGRAGDPGGQQGNDSVSSAAGSHPRDRLFGQATPGPRHHTTTAAGKAASKTALAPAQPDGARGRAGHSSIAAIPPPAKPQVQVERPQRSEDERPGGAARRRPHSAARKAAKKANPTT
jgi:transposase